MRARWPVGLLVPFTLLAACSSPAAGAPGGIDGPVLTSDRPREGLGGMDAIVAGGLALDDGCLFIKPDDVFPHALPGVRYAVIWPHGTRWDAEAEAVLLANGDRVSMGEVVTGGGGYVSPGPGNSVDQEVADEALRCAEQGAPGEVAVFNPGSSVERG